MCWRELGAQEVLDSHVQGARHHETVSKKRACFTVNNFLPRGAGGEAAAVFRRHCYWENVPHTLAPETEHAAPPEQICKRSPQMATA